MNLDDYYLNIGTGSNSPVRRDYLMKFCFDDNGQIVTWCANDLKRSVCLPKAVLAKVQQEPKGDCYEKEPLNERDDKNCHLADSSNANVG